MSKKQELVSPYKPRDLQRKIHEEATRFTVVVAHRRFGKSICMINHLIFQALRNTRRRPQYMFLAPEKEQAIRNLWEDFKFYTSFLPGVEYNRKESFITFPLPSGEKCIIYIAGASDPERFRGMYLDGAVIDEVGDMPKVLWSEVLRPALSDRLGFALFIGTPKGRNFFYDLTKYENDPKVNQYAEWKTFTFKASETGYVLPQELESAQLTMDPDKYNQEYECDFNAAVPGSYYGKALNRLRELGHIGDIGYNPAYPVITAWDLGLNNSTAIWFAQYYGDFMHLIDFIETGDQVPKIIEKMASKPYEYSGHLLPWDSTNRNNVGETVAQLLRDRYGSMVRIVERQKVDAGIDACKNLLMKCKFNEKTTSDGIAALSFYHSEQDTTNGVFRLTPVHDWSSHAADAFRYLATGWNKLQQGSTKSGFMKQFSQKPTLTYEDFDPLA